MNSNAIFDTSSRVQKLALAKNLKSEEQSCKFDKYKTKKEGMWAREKRKLDYLATSGVGEAVDSNQRRVTNGVNDSLPRFLLLLLLRWIAEEISHHQWHQDGGSNTNCTCTSRCHRRHFWGPLWFTTHQTELLHIVIKRRPAWVNCVNGDSSTDDVTYTPVLLHTLSY